ncbi:MAG: GatB/YqeY domain-containing protein [Chloroflexi bacterium]|nr:GatB/YqeY domain-containing protein [Chloroflexota bacterium]
MPLQERLNEDLRDAMRKGDGVRRSTIRLIRSAIGYEQIEQHKTLEDDGVIAVLAKMVKQRQESITEFKKGNRPDLVAKEEAELAIIRQYMPQQLTQEELSSLVRQAIAEVGAKGMTDMGKVMGKLMPQVRGKADGAAVSQAVRDALAGVSSG